MKYVLYLSLILMVTNIACSKRPDESRSWQEINSRDGMSTYLCMPPRAWVKVETKPGIDLADSTLPLMSWKIDEAVTVVFHNFPGQPIPPRAQIARWEKQLTNPDPSATSVEQVAWGGFEGLRLFTADEQNQSILAWAMTLPIFHKYALQGAPREQHVAADWTLKVSGPVDIIRRNEIEIDAFARSIRLNMEIPGP